MKETLENILLSQSPALFLAALLLIICYFVRRRNHHFTAVLDLILGILSIALGVALYFLGINSGLFTIKNFYKVGTPGLVGLGIVAVLAVILLIRSLTHAVERHRTEKAASRRETAYQKELEEVRQKAYASGMADAMAAETRMVPTEDEVTEPLPSPDPEAPAEPKSETSEEN